MCAAASCRHRQALAPRPLGGSHRQQLYQARPPAADTASTARARVVVCVCVARAATVTEARRCYPSSHSSTVCPLNRWPLRAAFSAASARACDAMNSLCPRARGGEPFRKELVSFRSPFSETLRLPGCRQPLLDRRLPPFFLQPRRPGDEAIPCHDSRLMRR
jgi:hypothetical protein